MQEENKEKELSAVKLMPLRLIDKEDDQFQTRYIENLIRRQRPKATCDSEDNVKKLAAKLKVLTERYAKNNPRKAQLAPITVFKDEGEDKYSIVAGAHRFKAYLLFNKGVPKGNAKRKKIPVRIFKGSADAALLYSHAQDTKPNLPKSQEQLNNSAWQLIYHGNSELERFTRREQANALDIKVSTVRRMVTTKNKLRDTNGEYHPNWKRQVLLLRDPEFFSDMTMMEDNEVEGEAGRFIEITHRNTFGRDLGKTTETILKIMKDLGIDLKQLEQLERRQLELEQMEREPDDF